MVKVIKSKKKDFSNFIWPLFGVMFVMIIGLTYLLANSNSYQSTSSSAAPKAPTSASGASISVVEPYPTLGSYVHYNYTLPRGVKENPTGSGTQARIENDCYQNGMLVYATASNAIDLKAGAQGELLGGGASQWLTNGGPAQCTATLYQWTYNGSQQFNAFATVNYSVGAKQ